MVPKLINAFLRSWNFEKIGALLGSNCRGEGKKNDSTNEYSHGLYAFYIVWLLILKMDVAYVKGLKLFWTSSLVVNRVYILTHC